MRIRVDESLPVALAAEFSGHVVSTVRAQRWLGLRNGALRAAADAGYEVIITADRSLRHQQNLATLGIAAAVIAGVRNRLRDLRPLLPHILAALAEIQKGEIRVVTR